MAQADCGDTLNTERGVDNRDVERSFQRLKTAGHVVYAGGCSWRLA